MKCLGGIFSDSSIRLPLILGILTMTMTIIGVVYFYPN